MTTNTVTVYTLIGLYAWTGARLGRGCTICRQRVVAARATPFRG